MLLVTVLALCASILMLLRCACLTFWDCLVGSTPVTVLVCRMGLRVENKQDSKLHERLRFLRDMMGVEHAGFFTFEGTLLAVLFLTAPASVSQKLVQPVKSMTCSAVVWCTRDCCTSFWSFSMAQHPCACSTSAICRLLFLVSPAHPPLPAVWLKRSS
jgi:hypothetical protein